MFVANFNTEQLYKFRVVYLRSREPGVPDELAVQQLSLDSEEYYKKNELFGKARLLRTSIYDVPKNIADSAYDMVGSSSTKNNVIDNYVNNQTIFQRLSGYAGVLAALGGKIVNVNIVVEVGFDDGSKATFKITGIDANNDITLELISAKDADNNDVPLTKSEIKNTSLMNYSAQGSDGLQEFIDAAARFGISISVNGGGGSGGGTMSCVSNKSGGLTCTYRPH